MDKQNHSDIAAFPALFGELEQFGEEQAGGLKKAGAAFAASLMGCSMLLFYILGKIA